jgi:hypothetical protein
VVTGGIAIDCHGREVILSEDKAIALPDPSTGEGWQGHKQLYLCLRYDERECECLPVIDPEAACSEVRKESGRVREAHELKWLWLTDEQAASCGWASERPCRSEESDGRGCLEPRCPTEDCILLAHIPAPGEAPDMRGRRTLPPPPDYLTHVCHINWPHGGTLTVKEVQELGTLRITFDRKLRAASGAADGGSDAEKLQRYFGPMGINTCTFAVQYGGGREDLDFVPHLPGHPPHLTGDGYVAEYVIDPAAEFEGAKFAYLVGHTVYVTLHCDFVHDTHDLPVDGNHFGTLPTGDGVMGGTFRSWFHVSADRGEKS